MICQADLDCALRYVPGDVCFIASALCGYVIRTMQENKLDETTAQEEFATTAKITAHKRLTVDEKSVNAEECFAKESPIAQEKHSEKESKDADARHSIQDECPTKDGYSAKDYPNPHFKLASGDPITLPNVCEHCLLDSLPAVVRNATGYAPNICWEKPLSPLAYSSCAGSCANPPSENTSPACKNFHSNQGLQSQAEQTYTANTPTKNVSRETFLPHTQDENSAQDENSVRPRVGIVGNALLCFDSFMNDNIVSFIESQGCSVVLPEPELIYTDDVRYLPQLELFYKQGVHHVIYLQSFGCLKGHIHARGALHELAALFPEMRITVIDYDPEASALNRENRIRLALAAAKS